PFGSTLFVQVQKEGVLVADRAGAGGGSCTYRETNHLGFIGEEKPCSCLCCACGDRRRTGRGELQIGGSSGRCGKGETTLRSASENIVDDAIRRQSSQSGEVAVGGAIQQLAAANGTHRSGGRSFVGRTARSEQVRNGNCGDDEDDRHHDQQLNE